MTVSNFLKEEARIEGEMEYYRRKLKDAQEVIDKEGDCYYYSSYRKRYEMMIFNLKRELKELNEKFDADNEGR